MATFVHICWSEMRKQHRIYFHGLIVYLSLLVWPVLELLTYFYMIKPFTSNQTNHAAIHGYLGSGSLEAFLLIGYIGYTFFFSLVQSAWHFSFERFEGTLELIFLSPANRFAVVLGNAISSFFESVWLITVFTVVAYVIVGNLNSANLSLLPLGFIALVVASIAWGTLLNSLFLLTRDSTLFHTLFQEPLCFFSGVRFPINFFKPWMLSISYIFPLTYCLKILRTITLFHGGLLDIATDAIILVFLIALMFGASYVLLRIAERHAKRTGALALF